MSVGLEYAQGLKRLVRVRKNSIFGGSSIGNNESEEKNEYHGQDKKKVSWYCVLVQVWYSFTSFPCKQFLDINLEAIHSLFHPLFGTPDCTLVGGALLFFSSF